MQPAAPGSVSIAQRRFGIVTNFREWPAARGRAPSRGALIPDYLRARQTPQALLGQLQTGAAAYAGFNLLLGDAHELWYASNRAPDFVAPAAPGIYGLSNRLLDTPWPKLTRMRRRFRGLARRSARIRSLEPLLAMLDDREPKRRER